MKIRKAFIYLIILLLLMSACNKNYVEEERVVEKVETPLVTEEAVETAPQADGVDIHDALSISDDVELKSYYTSLIESSFPSLLNDGDSIEYRSDDNKYVIVVSKEESVVNYLFFKYDGEKDGYILMRSPNYSGYLVIPESVNGKDVIAIESYAFSKNENIKGDLYIPSTVKRIGDYAFSLSSSLDGILVLSEGIEEIGDYAFSHTSLKGDIILPSTVKTIGEGAFSASMFDGGLHLNALLEDIPSYSFSDNPLTGNLVLNENIRTIGDAAFRNCNFSGYLILDNSLESIGEYAFENNTNLCGDIFIPSSVVSIAGNAFDGCLSLEGCYFVKEGDGFYPIGD